MEIKDKNNIKDTSWAIEQKTENVVRATYLITDFFDDREMLKWELRRSGLSFLMLVKALTGRMRDPAGTPSVSLVCTAADDIRRLFSIAIDANLVSTMNGSVLDRELTSLQERIRTHEQYSGFAREVQLDMRHTHSEDPASPDKDKGHRHYKRHKRTSIEHKSRDSQTDQGFEKRARREAILNFLKTNGDASIKDILKIIPSVSEKTIQRELMSLIDEGYVLKKGERRWSRYSASSAAS